VNWIASLDSSETATDVSYVNVTKVQISSYHDVHIIIVKSRPRPLFVVSWDFRCSGYLSNLLTCQADASDACAANSFFFWQKLFIKVWSCLLWTWSKLKYNLVMKVASTRYMNHYRYRPTIIDLKPEMFQQINVKCGIGDCFVGLIFNCSVNMLNSWTL